MIIDDDQSPGPWCDSPAPAEPAETPGVHRDAILTLHAQAPHHRPVRLAQLLAADGVPVTVAQVRGALAGL